MKRNPSGVFVKKIFIVALIMSLTQLTACSKSAPKCGDGSTKSLVVEILKDNSFKDDNDWKHVLDVKNIRTTGIDKDTGKNSCEAELAVETTYLNDKFRPAGSKSNKNVKITYTSEKTSEGKHYVSVSIPR